MDWKGNIPKRQLSFDDRSSWLSASLESQLEFESHFLSIRKWTLHRHKKSRRQRKDSCCRHLNLYTWSWSGSWVVKKMETASRDRNYLYPDSKYPDRLCNSLFCLESFLQLNKNLEFNLENIKNKPIGKNLFKNKEIRYCFWLAIVSRLGWKWESNNYL